MNFAKPIHWAEGLFLEPQHMQRTQALMQQQTWQALSLAVPYAYGLIDLELDEDALSAKRIVVKRLSAIMPDGTAISMPGNCHIEPLQLTPNHNLTASLIPGAGAMGMTNLDAQAYAANNDNQGLNPGMGSGINWFNGGNSGNGVNGSNGSNGGIGLGSGVNQALASTQALASGVMVYLSLSLMNHNEGNLRGAQGTGRYSLAEEPTLDENTGDNEVALIVREYQAHLTLEAAPSYATLPICKVRYFPTLGSTHQLQLDSTYIPPFITLTETCPLLPWATELLFMLKNCRVNLESDIEKDGFDSKLLTGSDMLRLNQLAALNSFIERAENFLQPGAITPFQLSLELCDLLGRLSVLNPLSSARTRLYQHDNVFPLFQELSQRLRALLNKEQSNAELGCLEFSINEQGYFGLFNLEDTFFSAGQYFLALSYEGPLKDRLTAIENGDNFRLLDMDSFKDRIRGVKLTHLRYPPHFLPSLNHTIWFKLMVEDSLRVWNYIHEERAMVIDFAPALFVNLKASLYFRVQQPGQQAASSSQAPSSKQQVLNATFQASSST